VGDLPADELQVVATARAQLESVVVLVHAEVGRGPVVAGNDLHAEDTRGEVLPRLRVAGPDAHVSKLRNAGHDLPLRGCTVFQSLFSGASALVGPRWCATRRGGRD